MATATLSSTPTTIDDGTAVTNWGGDTFVLNTTDNLEGSSCVECVQTANGNNDVYVTGSWDFSGTGLGDQHLRLWFLLTYVGNLSATNPIQVFLYDGTNTAYYYWDKGTSYTGGWAQAVVYTGDTPDSGTVNKASITRIGMRMVTSTKPRNATWNALYDAWKYGDGYIVYGGTSGDPIDWSHIATTDAASAYGIVTEVNGVYFLRGDIQIGDGTNTTYFEPDGQVAFFADEQVNTALYGLSFVDTASAVTNVSISGGAWSATNYRYFVDASDTDINSFTIDGLQVSGAGLVDLHAGADVQNCSFADCLQIDPSTATFEFNTISGYTGSEGGALLWPGGTTVANCTFTNNLKSIEITQTTAQTYDNLQFTDEDNTTKQSTHLNNGGTSITVNKNNGSNPQYYTATGGGTVTFSASFTHTLTNLEQNTEVTYVTSGTNTELYHVENASTSDGNGKYKTVYTHGGGASVDIFIHHPSYLPDISNIYGLTLPNASVEQKVQMFLDGNYENP